MTEHELDPMAGYAAAPGTAYASFYDLTRLPLPEDDLTLPNGMKIRLRGLSRQALFFNGKGTEDSGEIETRNLVSCMVEPKLTRPQAEAFMRSISAGAAGVISKKIRELSGMAEGADKSDVAEVRD
jgi:hypothetical protein